MYAALLNKNLVLAINEAQLVHQGKKALNTPIYRCSSCKKRVILVISQEKKPFFKHISFINNSGEKQEHLLSKTLLCSALVAYGYPAKMEVILAQNQLRADVLASNTLAFEIQCAPLSETEFNHRHSLYTELKIKDIWVVGKRHYLGTYLHKSQRKYLRKSKTWGWYLLEVNPIKMILRLKYFIELAPNSNQCTYKQREFNLDEAGIAKLLKFVPEKSYSKNNNYQFQLKYLRKQLREKTNFGRQLGEYLYKQRLRLEDLPEETLVKNRQPFEERRAIKFLQKKCLGKIRFLD